MSRNGYAAHWEKRGAARRALEWRGPAVPLTGKAIQPHPWRKQMSSQVHHTQRYSPKVLSIYGCVAALALVCTSVMAWSQQLQVSALKNLPAFTNTPPQGGEGPAPLVEAYNPASKLRLAISIKAPKMAEEEAFLKKLQDKSSP